MAGRGEGVGLGLAFWGITGSSLEETNTGGNTTVLEGML